MASVVVVVITHALAGKQRNNDKSLIVVIFPTDFFGVFLSSEAQKLMEFGINEKQNHGVTVCHLILTYKTHTQTELKCRNYWNMKLYVS